MSHACPLHNAPTHVGTDCGRLAFHDIEHSAFALMEPNVPSRISIVALAVTLGACLAACTKPATEAGVSDGVAAPETSAAETATPERPVATPADPPLLTQVNDRAPYAGEWAAERSHCDDNRKKWTIEPHRMAIVPAMRFCAFENVYVNKAADAGETSWSAGATCLAEGRESHDFLFFRVKDDMKEMRVTFNDSRSVQLYRCLAS